MKLLSKIKKNNDKIKKYIKDCFCIYKMNKMVLHYIECLKVTNNSAKIELRYKIGGINKLYSKFFDCGFKKNWKYWWRRSKLFIKRTKYKWKNTLISI